MSRKNPKNLQKEKNPIQQRREQLGITQLELHSYADVAINTVQRTEQGLMPKVPYNIYKTLYSTVAEDYVTVDFAVDAWKLDTRKKNVRYLNYLMENPETWFNWIDFRSAVSETKAGFCKLYCIHPHVLDHFEAPDKVYKRVKLADKIRRAFHDAGLSESDLDRIEEKLAWGVAGTGMVS